MNENSLLQNLNLSSQNELKNYLFEGGIQPQNFEQNLINTVNQA